MPRTLISGMPGAGKTTLIEHIHDLPEADPHYNPDRIAVDADKVKGLLHMIDSHGEPAEFDSADPHFFDNHSLLWRPEVMAKLVTAQPDEVPVYVAGVANNMPEIVGLNLFSHLVYLHATNEVLAERMTSTDRRNPGDDFLTRTSHPDHIASVLALSDLALSLAESYGAIIIDTSDPHLTVPQIGAMVLGAVEGPPRS